MKELQVADERAREIALYGPTGAPETFVPPTLSEATEDAIRACKAAGREDLLAKMVEGFIDILDDAIKTEKRYGGRL